MTAVEVEPAWECAIWSTPILKRVKKYRGSQVQMTTIPKSPGRNRQWRCQRSFPIAVSAVRLTTMTTMASIEDKNNPIWRGTVTGSMTRPPVMGPERKKKRGRLAAGMRFYMRVERAWKSPCLLSSRSGVAPSTTSSSTVSLCCQALERERVRASLLLAPPVLFHSADGTK